MNKHIDRNRPRQLNRLRQAAKFALKMHNLPYPLDYLRVKGWF